MAGGLSKQLAELNAQQEAVHHAAASLLFRTALLVNGTKFRITEIEFYLDGDPYTHADSQQINTTGAWYFHRANGKTFKGGTFKGLDLTCRPPGKAGGVLIRAIAAEDGGEVVEGPCKVVDRILSEAGCSGIAELVEHKEFDWSAFGINGILTLRECDAARAPVCVSGWPGYATAPRVGLSDRYPSHRDARLRFLSNVRATRKGKGDILRALVQDHGLKDAARLAGKTEKQLAAVLSKKGTPRPTTKPPLPVVRDDDPIWDELL